MPEENITLRRGAIVIHLSRLTSKIIQNAETSPALLKRRLSNTSTACHKWAIIHPIPDRLYSVQQHCLISFGFCTSATQARGGNGFLAAEKSDNTVPIIGTLPRAESKWFPGKRHTEELEPASVLPVMRYNINLGSMEPWCYKSVSDHQKGVQAPNRNWDSISKTCLYLNNRRSFFLPY